MHGRKPDPLGVAFNGQLHGITKEQRNHEKSMKCHIIFRHNQNEFKTPLKARAFYPIAPHTPTMPSKPRSRTDPGRGQVRGQVRRKLPCMIVESYAKASLADSKRLRTPSNQLLACMHLGYIALHPFSPNLHRNDNFCLCV